MIKQVRIQNYKSLANVTVDLSPVTVLIGRTGAGKTNFVEALRFLRDFLTFRNSGFLQTRGGWQHVLSATAGRPMSFGFSVEFDAPGAPEEYQYVLRFQQSEQDMRQPGAEPALAEERLALGGRLLFHQLGGRWVKEPEMRAPPQPGGLMLGGLTGLTEATIAYLVLSKGIGWYSFSDGVLTAAQAGQPNPVPADSGLKDQGENFIQAYDAIEVNLEHWQRSKEILAAVQRLDRSVKSIDFQLPGRNRITVRHSVGKETLSFELHQESEGFRRFFAHLIALYQVPSRQTLIFEEPEKGIHPGALAILADQFKACPAANRGQIILTTHSPELLNDLPPESIRGVEMQDSVTRIGPVTADQLDAMKEQLLRPGELLTVTSPAIVELSATGT